MIKAEYIISTSGGKGVRQWGLFNPDFIVSAVATGQGHLRVVMSNGEVFVWVLPEGADPIEVFARCLMDDKSTGATTLQHGGSHVSVEQRAG